MACYMKVKLTPLGFFSKKLLLSNSSVISSRPSTCLSVLKSQDPCNEIWSNQMTRLEPREVNSSLKEAESWLTFDHTNKSDNLSHSQQWHFELFKSSDSFSNQSSDLVRINNPDTFIQDTDKQEIVNYLQSNFIPHNLRISDTVLKNFDPKPLENLCVYNLATDPKDNTILNSQGASPSPTKDFPQKPSKEQISKIFQGLSETLPRFFVDIHNYKLYNPNIVFKNGIRGVTTRGLSAYVQHIAWIKILCHLKYARVKMEILKITKHEEDGTIRVRWRIVGLSGMRAVFFIWKLKPWQFKKNINTDSEWIDGFSIFHVGSDGLIYKHLCDKMMPDNHREMAQPPGNVGLKLATLIGLAPSGTCLGDFSILSNVTQSP